MSTFGQTTTKASTTFSSLTYSRRSTTVVFSGLAQMTSYPIPNDGPVGQMLEQLERHPFRPAHVHFLVGAIGYDRLCTHIFVAGDPYLESDSVFGVKDTLIVAFEPLVDAATKWNVKFDFVLKRL